jgi:hypothetical protein
MLLSNFGSKGTVFGCEGPSHTGSRAFLKRTDITYVYRSADARISVESVAGAALPYPLDRIRCLEYRDLDAKCRRCVVDDLTRA